MQHDHGMDTPSMWWCDGKPYDGNGGSWIGHVLPGAIMIVWALHWASAMLARHILRDGYRAASSWPFVGSEVLRGAWRAARHSGRPPPGSGNGKQQAAAASTPGARTPQQPAQGAAWLEPALKVLLPPLAILMELWLGHEAYHELICPPGTERAGHLNLDHINNWSHAAFYPPFVLSGMVDIASQYMELPPAMPNVALGFGFLCNFFTMASHSKHAPLDRIAHQLLALSMGLTAAFTFAEAVSPRSFMLSIGRCWALLLEGCWFVAMGRMLFEHRPLWQDHRPEDMAPSMYAPVVFVNLAVGIATFLVAAYIITRLAASLYQGKAGRPAAYAQLPAVEVVPLRGSTSNGGGAKPHTHSGGHARHDSDDTLGVSDHQDAHVAVYVTGRG